MHVARSLDADLAPTQIGVPAPSSTAPSTTPAASSLPSAPQAHPGDGRAAIAAEEEEPSGTGIYILLFVLVGVAMLAQCAQMGS